MFSPMEMLQCLGGNSPCLSENVLMKSFFSSWADILQSFHQILLKLVIKIKHMGRGSYRDQSQPCVYAYILPLVTSSFFSISCLKYVQHSMEKKGRRRKIAQTMDVCKSKWSIFFFFLVLKLSKLCLPIPYKTGEFWRKKLFKEKYQCL